jgi:surfactin synthase thioesterase subunit
MQEECRQWDINDLVFSQGMWQMYQPMLRSDFRLFDEYVFDKGAPFMLSCPITAFWGSKDRRVKQHLVQVSRVLVMRLLAGCRQ